MHYVLNGRAVVAEHDVMKWGRQYEAVNRRIACTRVNGVVVSTVFTGMNMNPLSEGEPLVFETTIHGGWFDRHAWRCCTYDKAEATHAVAVSLIERFRLIPGLLQTPRTWGAFLLLKRARRWATGKAT